MTTQAKPGNKVKVELTGRLQDGTVFESAPSEKPLEFTLGQGEIIAGVEEAVVGMAVGESKSTVVPADKAFGQHDERRVISVSRDLFPDEQTPEVGQQVALHRTDGKVIPGTVESIAAATVTVDCNHPLAGKELNFDLKLLEVE